jgi:hypothetical protein
MTPNEARDLILAESREGIAYSSRIGDYGTPERFRRLIEAIHVLQKEWRGRAEVNRGLCAALFVLGDQVNGNAHGAAAKGLKSPEWLWKEEGLALLSEALYRIFEDHEA